MTALRFDKRYASYGQFQNASEARKFALKFKKVIKTKGINVQYEIDYDIRYQDYKLTIFWTNMYPENEVIADNESE